MSDTQLKPCPFCGGLGIRSTELCEDMGGKFYCIECKSCRSKSMPQYASLGNDCPITYQQVRDAWNTRAAPKVKSLEWLNTPLSDENFPTYTAETIFGVYTYGLDFDNVAYYGQPNSSRWFEAKNIQDARSKLQADYERRMGDIHE